jgi:predicted AAA+ superfamily ATPase
VGKTWLVRDLAARSDRKLVEIDFERDPTLRRHFETNDPRRILGELSLALRREIRAESALLFLDEIQAAGEVIPKLRWFHEELPSLPVVAAGSLLEFSLADHEMSMPVGRITFRHVEPLSFPEYLDAHGQMRLLEILEGWRTGEEITPATHEAASTWFDRYAMVGGMPAIVLADVDDGGTPRDCRDLQRDLIATYRADFAKYAGRMDRDILDAVLISAAASVGSKFVYANVGQGVKHHQAKRGLELLAKAWLLSLVRHTAANGVPLAAEARDSIRKAVLLDVGLLHGLLGTPASTTFPARETLPSVLRGRIAEQVAGQQLRLRDVESGDGPCLFHWQRSGSRAGEIDYLVEAHGAVLPLELKSGAAGAMKSLHQFMVDKELDLAVRSDVHPPSLQDLALKTTKGDPVLYRLLGIPLYLLWNLDEILLALASAEHRPLAIRPTERRADPVAAGRRCGRRGGTHPAPGAGSAPS